MKEIWENISVLDNRYQISNIGNIRSIDRHTPVNGGIRFSRGKTLKPKMDRYGYLYIGIWHNGKKKHFTMHRLVAIHFIDNHNNYPQINHIDGNKLNNSVNNLEWCTDSYNKCHAKINGLYHGVKGSKHYKSKPIIDMETGIYYGCTREAAYAKGINPATLRDYLGRYSYRNKTSLRYA